MSTNTLGLFDSIGDLFTGGGGGSGVVGGFGIPSVGGGSSIIPGLPSVPGTDGGGLLGNNFDLLNPAKILAGGFSQITSPLSKPFSDLANSLLSILEPVVAPLESIGQGVVDLGEGFVKLAVMLIKFLEVLVKVSGKLSILVEIFVWLAPIMGMIYVTVWELKNVDQTKLKLTEDQKDLISKGIIAGNSVILLWFWTTSEWNTTKPSFNNLSTLGNTAITNNTSDIKIKPAIVPKPNTMVQDITDSSTNCACLKPY